MQEGEIATAELERLVFGVVSLDDVDHESVEIDESFADRARLDLALSSLQPDTERAIRLRFGLVEGVSTSGCSVGEIAEELGVTPSRVNQRLKRGISALEKFLTTSQLVNGENGFALLSLCDERELALSRKRRAKELLAQQEAQHQRALEQVEFHRIVDARNAEYHRQQAILRAHQRARSKAQWQEHPHDFSVSATGTQAAPERSGDEKSLLDHVSIQLAASDRGKREDWVRRLHWKQAAWRWFSDPLRLKIRGVAALLATAIAAVFFFGAGSLGGVFFVISIGAFIWAPFEAMLFDEFRACRRRRLAEEGIRAGYVTAQGFASEFA